MIRASVACAALLVGMAGAAHTAPPMPIPLQGTATVAFPPEDDAGALVIEAIARANTQVLVQAYTFTHRAIAEALVAARGRGIDVRVIADLEQAGRVETSLLGWLAERAVPVYLDGQHAAAHGKVMVLDADRENPVVITGSFNFTHAAQYRNAENLLILRGDKPLAERFASDWRRHRAHSQAMRK